MHFTTNNITANNKNSLPMVNRILTPAEQLETVLSPALVDRHGQEVLSSGLPTRSKGSNDLYSGRRSAMSRDLIRSEVFDVAAKLFKDGVDFDEDNSNWFVAPSYRLPKIWGYRKTSPLLIVFPTRYPEIPPVGCYLANKLKISPSGHFFDEAYHQASREPINKGWKWFCVYVTPGAWKPARIRRPNDWRHGDNLWTYLTLINEALAGRGN